MRSSGATRYPDPQEPDRPLPVMYIVLRRAETGLLAGSPSGVNRALGGRSGRCAVLPPVEDCVGRFVVSRRTGETHVLACSHHVGLDRTPVATLIEVADDLSRVGVVLTRRTWVIARVLVHADWVPEALEDGFKGRRVRRHSLLHAKILSSVARAQNGRCGCSVW